MSRPNHMPALACLVLACASTGAAAAEIPRDPLAQYRSHGDVQGLYEIREAARAFLLRVSPDQKHPLEPMDPDLRIFVPRCLAPLTARWTDKSRHNRPGVDVVCKRTGNAKYGRTWDVFVPLFEPEVFAKWRALGKKKSGARQDTR